MFVHFGLYSILGTGEWSKHSLNISDEAYESLKDRFEPKQDWAAELVKIAILYEWINVFIVIHTFSTLYVHLLSSYPYSFDCAR